MNIEKNQVSDLNAIISIELQPEDYQGRVNNVLRNYLKTAKIPGFRPGHVPMGMIKKMYGKAVLIEELNRLLSEELGKYIFENKIEVLGSPLPMPTPQGQNFEEGKIFKFEYEVGLAPSLTVKNPPSKIPYYLVKIDEKMVEDDVNDIRRRYGKFSNPETSDEMSIFYGEFNELDENGQLKESGHKTTTTLSVELITDVQKRSPFVGLKKEETIDFSPINTFHNETEVAAMLKLEKENAALQSNYRFTIMTVNKVEKAELNQELFDKLFGEGAVSSEEEFHAKIREGIASYFGQESDKKLKKDLKTEFLSSNTFALPDEFLKRMLKANQEKEIDEHTFDHEYFHLAEDLRWNLIQTKIAESNSIKVEEEEVRNVARQMVSQQFAQYGVPAPESAKLDELANNYLNESNNAERVDRIIRDNKVFDVLKKEVKLDMIEMPYQDFVGKVNEKTAHELEQHH